MVALRIAVFSLLLISGAFACDGEKIAKEALDPTPDFGTGPFYPEAVEFEGRGNDLTAGLTCRGDFLVVEATVLDRQGSPVAGAEVRIWQADYLGVYDHPNMPFGLPRDPSFGYFGRATTSSDGTCRFRTIIPPPYGPRSAHIHFAVLVGGAQRLLTEAHFQDDPTIPRDGFFARVAPDPDAVIVRMEARDVAWESETARRLLVAPFRIVLPD